MQARSADREGFAGHGPVKIHYEVHGDRAGVPTILLLPTWTIIHKRFWKLQLAYLARHFRVIVYDGPGNGRSDRPTEPGPYAQPAQVGYALAVLAATGTDRAVLVGLSMAANWALQLAADHPDRVLGTVLIGPSVPLGRPDPDRAAHISIDGPMPRPAPSRVPAGGQDPPSDWAKYHRGYWQEQHEDFLWFFLGQCFPEPHSTKPIEDGVGWGLETTGAVLVAKSRAAGPGRQELADWCARVRCPVLLIHGDHDLVSPLHRSETLAELTGGELVVIAGGGHIPLARDPVRVNLLIREFADRFRPAAGPVRRWVRAGRRPKRLLYLSSPIGLGHARRDLAIVAELRQLHPDLQVDWLAQDPVTRFLDRAGERVHPASGWLASESGHIESEGGEHDLHCFQALRTMDEILVANFMVFHDVVAGGDYDLVVGDESWEVDHFLHENPELKRSGYAWLTDFVGYLPVPEAGDREAYVAADYNAEMIGHIERYPRLRDRAVFVGDPEDIVDDTFGPGLPGIREWTVQHYDFAGYVTGFDAGEFTDRAALRAELGYHPDERVCVVSVGGSGVGRHLLRRVVGAHPRIAREVPGLRMVVVAGPRIDPAALPARDGLEVRGYLPDLHRHLAACDLAIVQGGLATCMELAAARRPFLYIPLQRHFEQQFHVTHRLRRYRAGRRLDYADLTPDTLAEAVAAEIGREVDYRPVPAGGAARAAALLAGLL